ncbi:TolC family outer membrane protein [Halomonas rhizosphaerae]|uniref:TolC family outer membrane protein n=1 Tax=Halomonas rhizosphaerae TaxID=3043296 RepID=A0ABT6V047_9GAMM|nr:TolC family outer membrane protein [Halomonas rhizosphaerae]MDI5891600.1 TolC family outer membrane protein [Halomonas rhizosphaerae]MDI5922960.1 TolC family outer membrane protein [Halomonas rhizosphaerae]
MTRHRTLRRALLPALIASAFAAPLQAADLLTITRDALENNAELASARSQTGSVEAGRAVERADLLPQVNTSADVSHNRQYESQTQTGGFPAGGTGGGDDNYNSAGLTLEATQALFDARNAREVEQAERQIDQQTYQLAATEQQVLIDVSSAYFEILRAYEVLEARRAQERAIGRQLEQAREQFEVGLIAITEVEEAKAAFDQARAVRIAAESDLQVRFEVLERLTGQRYSSIDALGEEMPIQSPTPDDRGQWVELAMENNPLVLASEAGVEVSRSSVEIARAQRLPTVDAFANYNYADDDRDGVEGHNSASQVGLRASLPLFTGGRTQASIRQNTYRLEASQYDFEAQRRDTVQQVRSRFTQVSNDVSTVEARAQAIVSNQSALDATRAGYEVGTRNIVDVLNAEQNFFNAVADHASARYDYVINLLSLRQQSGTLDVPAVEEVNAWLDGGSVSFTLPEERDPTDGAMEIGEPPRPRE